jgi:hypothetical protein
MAVFTAIIITTIAKRITLSTTQDAAEAGKRKSKYLLSGHMSSEEKSRHYLTSLWWK